MPPLFTQKRRTYLKYFFLASFCDYVSAIDLGNEAWVTFSVNSPIRTWPVVPVQTVTTEVVFERKSSSSAAGLHQRQILSFRILINILKLDIVRPWVSVPDLWRSGHRFLLGVVPMDHHDIPMQDGGFCGSCMFGDAAEAAHLMYLSQFLMLPSSDQREKLEHADRGSNPTHRPSINRYSKWSTWGEIMI